MLELQPQAEIQDRIIYDKQHVIRCLVSELCDFMECFVICYEWYIFVIDGPAKTRKNRPSTFFKSQTFK